MSGDGTRLVCVTGASGYIASWLVKLLLLRGYTVKGTVRDPNDSRKVDHLLKLDGAKERLHLIKANLLEEGSFDPAIEGCEGVFHTASPVSYNVKDPQTELIDPAVNGTLNILKSCAKSPSVKRVVLTSSTAAVVYNGKPRTPEVVVDETWFSKPDLFSGSALWSDYVLSKTLAEDAAWKFVKENNIDMVVINPAMVIGPLLQPTLNTSAAELLNLINVNGESTGIGMQIWKPCRKKYRTRELVVLVENNGAQTFPNFSLGWIHVKDVANAHIQAFEISSASGRYCLVESVAHYIDIVKILRELYPTLQLPDKCADHKPLMPRYQYSKEKAKTLGIEFIPLDVGLKEIVESLKEKKFINF